MASTRDNKPAKKTRKRSSSKKTTSAKRIREERADAFRRGVNSVLLTILVFVIVCAAYYGWEFLGRPGWSRRPHVEQTVCLELYFRDNAVAYLVPVHRRVTLAPGDSRTARAVQEFATGPRDPSLARVYPANIPIPGVRSEGDVAIVDFPEEIRGHLGGGARERALLDALTLTVAGAGECSKVRVLIAGEPQEATPEGYALDEPLDAPEFVNRAPDSSIQGESGWVTAYFLDSTGRYLIPLALEVPIDSQPVEHAVTALLGNPPRLVDPPPLPVAPSGFSLERLVIEDGVATVELRVPDTQTAFLGFDINLFRRALYLTLKKCCGVNDVSLMLNGRPLEFYERFGNLEPLSTDDCWNPEINQPDSQDGLLQTLEGVA